MVHSGQPTFPIVLCSGIGVEKRRRGRGEPISQMVTLLFLGKTNDSCRTEYPELSDTCNKTGASRASSKSKLGFKTIENENSKGAGT